ncbi:Zinc finger protein [Musa troglodytarum]|nr:Zinc finger protein [Musa troglodytarum]
MGSKGGAAPPPSSVVCCMCGDRGLMQELFRCKLCLLRSQHRYCSDFYPKAESYRTCNWCLREEGERSLPKEAMKDPNSLVPSSSNNDSSNGSGASKLHRGAFSSQLNKPIKKPRLLDWSASDVTDRVRSGELSSGSGRARQVLRGKARRYKLLEEVSS